MGLPLLPAYADPLATGHNILKGVCFASAAAGILDESGRNLVMFIGLFNIHLLKFSFNILSIFKNKSQNLMSNRVNDSALGYRFKTLRTS